jgi:hypothetical protein
MATFIIEFSRSVVIDVEIAEGTSIDDIKDIAWREFGSRELVHSDFDIIEIIKAEDVVQS